MKGIDLKELPQVTIRLKDTVVQVLPDGVVISTKAGRELEAWRIVNDEGEYEAYIILGTSRIPRLIPRGSAEEINRAGLN